MNQQILFVLVIVMLLPFLGCSQSKGIENGAYRLMLSTLLNHNVPEMNVQAASSLPETTVFLDAREPAEYEVSHIAGARPVGYDHFDMEVVNDIEKDQAILVYCSVGYRSEKISEQLIAAGYQNVHNLYGGIFEWKNQGHPVVDTTGKNTENVHAYSKSWGVWLRKGKKVYQ